MREGVSGPLIGPAPATALPNHCHGTADWLEESLPSHCQTLLIPVGPALPTLPITAIGQHCHSRRQHCRWTHQRARNPITHRTTAAVSLDSDGSDAPFTEYSMTKGMKVLTIDRSINRSIDVFVGSHSFYTAVIGRQVDPKSVEMSTNHSRWRSIDRSIDRQHLHSVCHTKIKSFCSKWVLSDSSTLSDTRTPIPVNFGANYDKVRETPKTLVLSLPARPIRTLHLDGLELLVAKCVRCFTHFAIHVTYYAVQSLYQMVTFAPDFEKFSLLELSGVKMYFATI